LKVIYNVLLSAVLIALGVSLIAGGLHATAAQPMAGTTSSAMPPIGVSIKTVNPAAQPVVTSEAGITSPTMNPAEYVKTTAPVLNPAAELPGMRQATTSGATSAQLVGYGTDKETYKAGETATGYIILKNTGSTVINDATLRLSVARSMGALGMTTLGSMDFSLTDLGIKPGETKRADFSVKIPAQYAGFSTTGSYDLSGTVLANGKQVGTFTRHINVV
jgi:hypothetical protein